MIFRGSALFGLAAIVMLAISQPGFAASSDAKTSNIATRFKASETTNLPSHTALRDSADSVGTLHSERTEPSVAANGILQPLSDPGFLSLPLTVALLAFVLRCARKTI